MLIDVARTGVRALCWNLTKFSWYLKESEGLFCILRTKNLIS